MRKKAKKLVDILTPIMKAHFTDNAVDNTNSAMQVFGGHGYIKEHGMEQFNRDARITRMYEGTNGIQALDLIGRKVMKENLLGAYLGSLWHDIVEGLKAGVCPWTLLRMAKGGWCRLWMITVCLRLKAAAGFMLAKAGMPNYLRRVMQDAGGMATDYLKLFSVVAMGHMWIKMATVAKLRLKEKPEGSAFYESKIQTARFYMNHILPQTRALSCMIRSGSKSLMSLAPGDFAHAQTNIGLKSWTKPERPVETSK